MSAQAAPSDLREYEVQARSTAVPGRVMCSARNHHIVVDGPVQNGFPGEEITPSELFLQAVAACGVELVQMLARQQDVPLQALDVAIKGMLDRGNPAHPDYTVFNTVRMQVHLKGVTQEQGMGLVEAFKRR
jgi:uncharacterized OsmC-like protein